MWSVGQRRFQVVAAGRSVPPAGPRLVGDREALAMVLRALGLIEHRHRIVFERNAAFTGIVSE
jgi:hypothetical protein